jgi:hypothetical protein
LSPRAQVRSLQEGVAMRIRFPFALVLPVMLLAGCNSQQPDEAAVSTQRGQLGDECSTSLADLLAKPRSELADMGQELARQIDIQRKSQAEGTHQLVLLENPAPLVVPVLREAQFSPKAGFSLPSYVKEDAKDSALAIHLARFGDAEAAAKLVDPADTETARLIESYRLERSYPVEWTRLVAYLIYSARLKLANDDVAGGTEIVALHKQLGSILDAKATAGPLGAALLPLGKGTLSQAATAWQQSKLPDLASRAKHFLGEWGQATGPVTSVPYGSSQAAVEQLLHSAGKNHLVAASNINRALDLLDLPFPAEGGETILAEFDGDKKLNGVSVLFPPGSQSIYRRPEQLAMTFEERGFASDELPKTPGLESRKYKLMDGESTVTIVRHGAGLGALARFQKPDYKHANFALGRNFGTVSFERSFEQNRLRLTPQLRDPPLTTTDSEKLKNVKQPLPGLKLAAAGIQQFLNYNLLSSVTFTYPTDSSGVPPLQTFLLPLWSQSGPPELHGETDAAGGHLGLSWTDKNTEYRLQLPYENGVSIELLVSDRQGDQNLNDRIAEVVKFDNHERSERLAAGKPNERLPRQIEMFELGMTKAQVMSLIPGGKTALKREISGGIVVTLAGEPGPSETHVPRQLFVRFGEGDKVVELRARYEAGPAAKASTWMRDLLAAWSKRAGAAMPFPATWAQLWGGEKVSKSRAAEYFWEDDRTLATLQSDAAGVELRIRDCPPDQPGGIPLPPLEYLSRGPDNVLLDMPRDQIVSRATTKPESTPDGALLLRPASGPYDAIVVYFDKGKADRIVARHGATDKKRTTKQEWGQAVLEAWGGGLASLGWWRRQELTNRDVLQALGWHDDRTQIRTFWQEDNKGAVALYTEWKHVPIP